MKYININGMQASEVILGCMRIGEMELSEIERLVKTAMEAGVNFFDHADIYGGGKCEEVFAKALNITPSMRDNMLIQTKCGIRDCCYDFSREHILESVDNSLKRLNMDYVDILLLHRPDTLMEPDEVAEAFDRLYQAGKVKAFGVSNHNPMQIALLQKYLKQKLVINQMQVSITNTGMIDCGLNVNMEHDPSVNRDGSILEYCRLQDIVIQSWSPMQYGFFEGVFLDNPKFPELNCLLTSMAKEKGVTTTTLAIAWLLRHPGIGQVVSGSTNLERTKQICQASGTELSRKEWYEIYLAAGNKLP